MYVPIRCLCVSVCVCVCVCTGVSACGLFTTDPNEQ